MKTLDRYLHFDNLDLQEPVISARCSECGKEFHEVPRQSEHIDELLMRIRAAYEAHVCETTID